LNLPLIRRGKVRDVYELDERHLLVVTSDRLSAFDVVLPTLIPGKGAVLTQLTRFWMKKLSHLVKNHLPEDRAKYDELLRTLAAGQSEVGLDQMEVVRRAEVFPVECVVRGYLAGSGWKDYQRNGAVCSHSLPAGLKQCARLGDPIFTPSTKAAVGHDENITVAQMENLLGKETARKLEELSLAVYKAGREHASQRGILIADTKFEFGVIDGEIALVDEVLTPDSSRFWPADQYEPGRDQPSFDKQIVRNYLMDIGWDRNPPAPCLPLPIAQRTADAYREILELLTKSSHPPSRV
jgi:phosphoribosylaminoimidazole-succinocarboxamide synthase